MSARPRIASPLRLATAAAFTMALSLAAVARATDTEFVKLFNGKDLTGFVFVGAPASTWSVQDGMILCSGRPNGYFATEKKYRNYVLRFDWRYARPADLQDDASFRGNSGLLVHITGEHKVWPQCIEVQLMNRDAGNIFAIFGSKFQGRKTDRQKAAIKPVGEWNHEEIVSRNGTLSCTINGELVCEGTGAEPDSGPIGWQSEGAEIHFRNIEIRELETADERR